MRPVIFLRFNTRYDNIGDQLIFYYLSEEARQHGDVYMVMSCPEFMNQRVLRTRQALIMAIKNHLFGRKKIFFIEPPGARFISKNPHVRPAIKTRAINFIWKLLGTKFLLFGVSFDPKMSLHECFNFRFVGVRDQLSLTAAKEQNLTQAQYCPDLAFLMPQSPKLFSTELNALVSFRYETPDVGAHHFGEDLKSCLHSVFKTLEPFIKEFKVYHQVIEDLDFNKEIAETYTSAFPIKFTNKMPTVLDLSTLTRDCSIAISNRLHVLLPAIAAGTLPIALISSKHYKIHSIFETLGMKDCIVYIDGEESVAHQILKIMSNAEKIVQRNNVIFSEQSIFVRKIIKDHLCPQQTL